MESRPSVSYLSLAESKFGLVGLLLIDCYWPIDVSLMSLSIFVQNILTLVQEAFSFASWPSLQVQKHEVYLQQWRNPDASIAYQTSPNVLVEVIFTMSVLLKSSLLKKTFTDCYTPGTFFFNVESLLFFFWSLMLFVSVWEIENRVLRSGKFVTGTKCVAFILPAFQTCLINLGAVKGIPALHITIEVGVSEF